MRASEREAIRSRGFLEFLKEEGIEEIYLPGVPQPSSAPSGALASPPEGGASRRDLMVRLRDEALQCRRCAQLAASRKKVVFGAGNLNAEVVFVGEAPGRDEDIQGRPFVGRAGQLLTRIIESIGLDRREVFICNVLKCRPPGNRSPQPDEILNCEPFLRRQIEIIRPRILCALGTFAAQSLLRTGESIGRLRGRFHHYRGIKTICTYHPAYLLRNPEDKRKVWSDMKMLRAELKAGDEG